MFIISQFAHVGGCQSQPESTTSSALKQAQDAQAAQHMEGRLPLTYRAREQVSYRVCKIQPVTDRLSARYRLLSYK